MSRCNTRTRETRYLSFLLIIVNFELIYDKVNTNYIVLMALIQKAFIRRTSHINAFVFPLKMDGTVQYSGSSFYSRFRQKECKQNLDGQVVSFCNYLCKKCIEYHHYKLRNIFFSIWGLFHEYSRITGLQGMGEGIPLTPHYHLHSLHRHSDISRAITAESSPLRIASSRTRFGNLWFPSTSR